jgi:prepilin-type N-terminal cleavage/methylation domain-containing protein
MKSEKGFTLIGVVIAIALVGIIAAAFLGGLANASKALFTTDTHATGNNLAESQMEYVKKQPYATAYIPAPIPSEYVGYSVTIDVTPLEDGNIQKITVTVSQQDKPEVIILEGYKVS